jgi:hypothetical protein
VNSEPERDGPGRAWERYYTRKLWASVLCGFAFTGLALWAFVNGYEMLGWGALVIGGLVTMKNL